MSVRVAFALAALIGACADATVETRSPNMNLGDDGGAGADGGNPLVTDAAWCRSGDCLDAASGVDGASPPPPPPPPPPGDGDGLDDGQQDQGSHPRDGGPPPPPPPPPDAAPPGPDPCEPIPGVGYRSLGIIGPPTDRPPPHHADLNPRLRGWTPTGGFLGLVDYDGPTDGRAPKLYALFSDDRVPEFVTNYRVGAWDWGCNCRGEALDGWDVTMAGFGTRPGEPLEVPRSGYDIGEGLAVMVLRVDDDSITMKYTREDNVVIGYTLHVVGVCPAPELKQLYDRLDSAGRGELPALGNDQAFGRARGAEVQVAIVDSGEFLDPRSRKDWW